ncbi:MAG: ParB-like protein [Formosimonas sp.]
MKKFLCFFSLIVGFSCSKGASICDSNVQKGGICRAEIAQIHPTQSHVGMLQVEETIAQLTNMSHSQREKRMLKKEIPVVIQHKSDGQMAFYLVDRHHLTRALWAVGEQHVWVKVIGHLPDDKDFWPTMVKQNWVWLFDEQGRAILPEQLPQNLASLQDNPYRSLTGQLEDEGYIDKSAQKHFIELVWAQWLRKALHEQVIHQGNMHDMKRQAIAAMCQPQARACKLFCVNARVQISSKAALYRQIQW